VRDEIVKTIRNTLGFYVSESLALRVVSAIESAGFKIVGREPTAEMVDAILDGTPDSFHFTAAQPLWAAAFDAAPLYGEVGE